MKKKPIEDLEDAWRVWLDRPPRTSPEQAARAISDRLSRSGTGPRNLPRFSLRRPLLAAALLLITVAVGWRFLPWKGQDARVVAVAAEPSVPALGEDVLVMRLDSKTLLYLTLPSDPDGRPAESNPGDLL